MIVILYAERGNFSREKYYEQKDSYSQQDFDEAMRFLQRGLDLHYVYGRKIFAVSRVIGAPEYYDDEESYYWHSHIYADIGDMTLLDSPVIGKNFDMLRDLLISYGNILPDYVLEAEASPLPYAAAEPDYLTA